MAYDLTVLDPTEFEALVSDLLSRSWGSRLESFKEGKDDGIDLRHSRVLPDEPTTIVQCKRYSATAFSRLLTNCKQELPKLEKLEPQKYVLATSVPLSPANKAKILGALSPWCRSTADVYGSDDLNGLLREFPEVERSHFKLWISGTAVLERVLHAGLFALTEAKVEEARHRLSTLVVHEGLERALDHLRQRHHVLIVGNPGIGKTTLAQMIVCHYVAEGFEVAWVVGNIEDAWQRIHAGQDTQQRLVIVYDDFLGRLRFESPRFEKNEEASLFSLVDKAARSSSIRIILTTREYILEDAKRLHGAFHERADALMKHVLSLELYTTRHRAQMVFNHLYFSDLPQSRIEKFVAAKAYWSIIRHRHFNPRIVEYITKYANSRMRTDDEFAGFVEDEFENPSRLWEYPYMHEVGHLARQILAVLWTFGGTCELEDLRDAISQVQDSSQLAEFGSRFTVALKQLDGSFVDTNWYPIWGGRGKETQVVSFQNPSIEELVERKVLFDPYALASVAKAVATVSQARTIINSIQNASHDSAPMGLWETLREKGKLFSGNSSGRLQRMNFASSQTSRTYWSRHRPAAADMAQVQLATEGAARIDDDYTQNLREKVLTTHGWQAIVNELEVDENVAYRVLQLQKWIAEDSGWGDHDKMAAERCLREAVFGLLADRELPVSWIETAVILYRTVTTISSDLPDELRNHFQHLATRLVEIIPDITDEPDIVRAEACSLREFGELMSWPVESMYEKLVAEANALESDPEGEEDQNFDRLSKSENASDRFDIDDLFEGLLDRC